MRWKTNIKETLSADQKMAVFSTREFLKFTEKKHDKSERTTKNFLTELLSEGIIKNVFQGLYRVIENTQNHKPQNILHYVNPQAIVSLDTVFNEFGGKSIRGTPTQTQGGAYAIVPINNPNKPPRVGIIKSEFGKIALLSLKESHLNIKGIKLLDDTKPWKQHTPEAAVAFSLLMNANNRFTYSLETDREEIAFPQLKLKEFEAILQKLPINSTHITKNIFRFKDTQQEELLNISARLDRKATNEQIKPLITKKIHDNYPI